MADDTAYSGAVYYSFISGAPTGAVGRIMFALKWPNGDVAVAATAAGIVETAPGSYVATQIAPRVSAPTAYVRVWADPDFPSLSATEALTVLPVASAGIDAGARALRRQARSKARAVTRVGAVLSIVYGQDADAIPSGAVTVLVVNAAGVAVFTGTATQVGSSAQYTIPLPSASLSFVDDFAVVWTAVVGSDTRTDVTALDVCSARLFTVAQMRAQRDVTNAQTDAQIELARVAAEDFIEAACGRAFVLRYFEGVRNQVEWFRHAGLRLEHPDVQTLRALSIGGVPVTVAPNPLPAATIPPTRYLSDFNVGDFGFLYGPDKVTRVNVDVAYEHGEFAAGASRAALILARHFLISGPIDDRATGLPVEGGGVISLLTPGVKGSLTGLPEVDAFIAANVAA